ncbi:MAG: nucleotidyltransferase domain-containing protein [Thermodesulfobacteriota bacterium]
MLNQTERDIVQELKLRLTEAAGDLLQAVIVYGSRAWGQAGPDADLDVAVLIRGCTPELEAALQEAAYQVMWEHDFTPLIALKVFDAQSFLDHQEKGFSFYRKVAQEGIAL